MVTTVNYRSRYGARVNDFARAPFPSASRETHRAVISGIDPDTGQRAEIIAMAHPAGCWELHCATPLRTVRLDPDGVAALVNAMSPEGIAEVAMALRTQSGGWQFVRGPLRPDAEMPAETARELQRALVKREKSARLGWLGKRMTRPA